MSDRQQDPFVGKEILGGQFRIVERIGSGGMGSVYRAEEPQMGRQVAIKILHQKLKERKDLVSRFRREARAMSQLTHPNTVRVFMYGELEDSGALYIVMELLEGLNLNQTVKRGGVMDAPRAISILVPVCHALHEAHQLGIVHRDLKPENIFICRQAGLVDYPKVLDFGLAKVTEAQMQPGSLILTQQGMVFGTPEFMSPEQARGLTLDARSDVYSLACILYEALSGKLPYDAKTPMEYVSKHVSATPIPLAERAPGRNFPPGLWPVLKKALAKRPEDRYDSALSFATALEAVVRAPSELPPSYAVESTVPPPAVENPPAPAASGRRFPEWVVLVTVAVLCLALGGVLAVLAMTYSGK
ncbi:MAG: serine/threonine protein kinase [Sorangiineae bacterium NIC37A_2]|jgi:serine/threonine protein kinase|nr:MAG: serine/threonine protein kinase [Sorangiineae bacterium NIC37A_2]